MTVIPESHSSSVPVRGHGKYKTEPAETTGPPNPLSSNEAL
jgi:hypothetical protein